MARAAGRRRAAVRAAELHVGAIRRRVPRRRVRRDRRPRRSQKATARAMSDRPGAPPAGREGRADGGVRAQRPPVRPVPQGGRRTRTPSTTTSRRTSCGTCARYVDPAGCIAIDVGGGPGYTAEALKAAGAQLSSWPTTARGARAARPQPELRGPMRRAGAPVARRCREALVYSSNVLEHVPDWAVDALRDGPGARAGQGLGYLTFTNWYSPWGGHETSPWHYFGGRTRPSSATSGSTGSDPRTSSA